MMYVYQGDVWLTPAGQTVKEYLKLCEHYDEREVHQRMIYIYYLYTKEDNPYFRIPPHERRNEVCRQYDLFGGNWVKVENCPYFKNVAKFYEGCIWSDNDRNREAARAKAEHWRGQLMNIENTPEEDEKIAKALQIATKLADDYAAKALMEGDDMNDTIIPLYLFEVPEDQKPHHLKLVI